MIHRYGLVWYNIADRNMDIECGSRHIDINFQRNKWLIILSISSYRGVNKHLSFECM